MERGKTWVVRDGDEKDLEGILSLRKIVFGEMEKDKLDPRFWRWQFLEAPDGKGLIYIVEDQGKIIGHFADIPRRFSVGGDFIQGTLSLDLMVHPNYRRGGVFAQMGSYAIQRVKKENGLFMMAYPIRKETMQGLGKIGWKEVAELPTLVYPIRFRGIVNRYLHFSLLSFFIGGVARFFYSLIRGTRGKKKSEEVAIEKVTQLDEQFDRFWRKVLSLYSIMGVRDRVFLSWRYLRNPTRTYVFYRAMKEGEMKGYIVLRKVDLLEFNSAVIVDLLALDEDVLKALVEKGIEHSQKEGSDILGCIVPKYHPYYRALKQNGFLATPKKFHLMVYSHSDNKGVLSHGDWYVNWGDTDVI